MKKLFLSLCFMGLATFAFANNNNENKKPNVPVKEEVKVEVIEKNDGECTVTVSATKNGVTYSATSTASTCRAAYLTALDSVAAAFNADNPVLIIKD